MGTPFTSRTFAGVEAGAFFFILLLGALAGAAGFLWTLESAPPQGITRVGAGFVGPGDPDRGFINRVQGLYAMGDDQAVIQAGVIRRRDWPADPNGWLLAAFAHERLGQEPGLNALYNRAAAQDLWQELLDQSRDPSAKRRVPTYYEGWALMGLGRPLPARECFGRWSDATSVRLLSSNSYNQACYLALAGDHEAALAAWVNTVLRSQRLPVWTQSDPDLESLHGTFEFEIWRTWRRLILEDAAARRAESLRDGAPPPPVPGRQF